MRTDQTPLFPILLIATISFIVFSLITPAYTGFATLDAKTPDKVELDITRDIYDAADPIKGDLDVYLSGPLSETSVFYASLSNQEEELPILDAFNDSSISFTLSERQMKVKGSSKTKTLVYPDKGKQNIFFQLPAKAIVQHIDMGIHGKPRIVGNNPNTSKDSYPSFITVDIGMNGDKEWEYLGDLANFSDNFTLPPGLNEQVENRVIITDEEAYYCEIIKLPRARDYRVSAKYGLRSSAALNKPRDLEVVLFSYTGSGDTLTAKGGGNTCDLFDTNSTSAAYYSCDLEVPFAIEGNHLVCVHNAEHGNNDHELYDIMRDSDKGSGYRCSALNAQETKCTLQTSGDFHIKVQTGEYSRALNRRITLREGFTGNLFQNVLNNYIKTCNVANDKCVIPLSVATKTPGVLILDDLVIRYKEGSSLAEENNFYDVEFTPSVIASINNVDLTEADVNTTFSLPLGLLDLIAPTITKKDKNYSLRAGIKPGPSDKEYLLIKKREGNDTSDQPTKPPEDIKDAVAFYKSLFNSLLLGNSDLLDMLGYKTKLQDAISTLNKHETTLRRAVNGTNATQASIKREVDILVKKLPVSLVTPDTVNTKLLIGFNDITHDLVFADQQTENAKKKIYTLQQSVNLQVIAKTYELSLFDKSTRRGTYFQQTVSSGFTDGYFVLIVPPSIATSATAMTFSIAPEVVQSTPLIVRWPLSKLGSKPLTYRVTKNVATSVNSLKGLVVPKVIPEATPTSRAVCGDNVCDILEVNGRRIPLEDKYSCPQDCKSSIPWTPLIIVGVIFVILLIWGVFYKGPYSLHALMHKEKKSTTLGGRKIGAQKLFANFKDEHGLKMYISTSLKKNVPKATIVKNLTAKGWTKAQVDYAFRTLKK